MTSPKDALEIAKHELGVALDSSSNPNDKQKYANALKRIEAAITPVYLLLMQLVDRPKILDFKDAKEGIGKIVIGHKDGIIKAWDNACPILIKIAAPKCNPPK